MVVAAAEFSSKINENTHYNCFLAYNEYIHNKLWTADSCPLIPMCDIYKTSGTLIATDIVTAKILKDIPINVSKYFYIWQLEYIDNPNFSLYKEFYNNTDYTLISRSEKYKSILKRTWGVNSILWKDFSYEDSEFIRPIQ